MTYKIAVNVCKSLILYRYIGYLWIMKFVAAVLFFLLSSSATSLLSAQELNARVEVNAPQVQNLNPRVVTLLQNVVQSYLNSRSWTGSVLSPQERVDCGFVINILSFDGLNEFSAEAIIRSTRPVFGTDYSSTVLSFRDRFFHFSYEEGEQLLFHENQNLSPLASLLAFYAYLIIGMDRDTFRLNGGTEQFSMAKNIVHFSQNTGRAGWQANESMDNRYWLVDNMLDPRYSAYREFSYVYHREGLDRLVEDGDQVRSIMATHLNKLTAVDRFIAGNSWSVALFSAKSAEFAGVFSQLTADESRQAYALLTQLDPTNMLQYEPIKRRYVK